MTPETAQLCIHFVKMIMCGRCGWEVGRMIRSSSDYQLYQKLYIVYFAWFWVFEI